MTKPNSVDLARWAVPGIVGLVLVIFAGSLKSAIEVILGIGLILAGVSGILNWWNTRKARGREGAVLVIGSAIGIGLGIWILTHLHTFDAMLKFILGGLLIVVGLQWLFANGKTIGFNPMTLAAGISILLGIVIMFTKSGLEWPIRIVGIGMIVSAVCGLLGLRQAE